MTQPTNQQMPHVSATPAADADAILRDRLRQFFPALDDSTDVNQVLSLLVQNHNFVQAIPEEITTADQITEAWQARKQLEASKTQAPQPVAPQQPVQSASSFSLPTNPEDWLKPVELNPIVTQFCTRDPKTGQWVAPDARLQEFANEANDAERFAAIRGRKLQTDPASIFMPLLEKKLAEQIQQIEEKYKGIAEYQEREAVSRTMQPVEDQLFATDPSGQKVPTATGQRFLAFTDSLMKRGASRQEAIQEALTVFDIKPQAAQPAAPIQQQAPANEPAAPAPAKPFIPEQTPDAPAPVNTGKTHSDAWKQAVQSVDAPASQTPSQQAAPASQAVQQQAPVQAQPANDKKQQFVDGGRQVAHQPVGNNAAGAAPVLPDFASKPGPLPKFKEIKKAVDSGQIPILNGQN